MPRGRPRARVRHKDRRRRELGLRLESLESRLPLDADSLDPLPTIVVPPAADGQDAAPFFTTAAPGADPAGGLLAAAAASATAPMTRQRRLDVSTARDFTVRFLPRFQTYASQLSAIQNNRINRLIAPASPMTLAYKAVVAINVDTLYTSATVNLTDEPQILTIPAYDFSYSIIQVDGFGTVLRTGMKSTPEGGTYALVGPNFRGPLPRDVVPIRVGVNWSQIAIRTSRYTQNADGTYTNTELQAAEFRGDTRLQSLSAWQASRDRGGETQVLPIPGNFSFPMKTFVDTSLQGDPRAFLDVLQAAMRSPTTGPLSKSDRALIRSFDRRFTAAKEAATGGAFTRLSDICAGARAAHDTVVERWRQHTIGNGWAHFNNLGNWGRQYLDRAAGNLYLQYGNVRTAAYYAQAFADDRGRTLSGADGQVYTITFAADQIPECGRFWSITAYTGDAIELVPNPAQKYAVASYTPGLERNEDGSITVTLRTIGAAETIVDPNVLPIPAGRFSVRLRIAASTTAPMAVPSSSATPTGRTTT